MPKTPHTDPPVGLHITIPSSLHRELTSRLADPLRPTRRRYGSLSRLITLYLRHGLRAPTPPERLPALFCPTCGQMTPQEPAAPTAKT